MPLAWRGGDIDSALADAEDRYRRRGLRPCFKITDAALPAGLDERLEARGYAVEGRSLVLTGGLAEGEMARDIVINTAADAAWWRVAAPAESGEVASRERLGIASRLPAPTGFAAAMVDGAPASVALATVIDGWCCVSSVRTAPGFRRRGIAARVMIAIGGWARRNGAHSACLQVEAANSPAVALYTAAGLRPAYGYHYRVLAA